MLNHDFSMFLKVSLSANFFVLAVSDSVIVGVFVISTVVCK